MSSLQVVIGRLWRAFLADLDLYSLIAAGVVFTILGVFGIADAKDLSSVILAGLTLLAFSQARTRRAAAGWSSPGRVGAVFMADFPEDLYTKRASESREYIFVGLTGYRTVGTGLRNFQDMLNRGAQLRFLLLDPGNDALLRAANSSGATSQHEQRIRRRISSALDSLGELRSPSPTAMQIRFLPFLPSICINGFSLSRPDGSIFVQHLIQSTIGERSPIYRVGASDGFWYRHYVAEVERLWSAGTPGQLPP